DGNRVGALPGRDTRGGDTVHQRGRDHGRPPEPGGRGGREHPGGGWHRVAGDHDPDSRDPGGRRRRHRGGRRRGDRHRRDPGRPVPAGDARAFHRRPVRAALQAAKEHGVRDRGRPGDRDTGPRLLSALLRGGRRGRAIPPAPRLEDHRGGAAARRLRRLRGADREEGGRGRGGSPLEPHALALALRGADVGRGRAAHRDGRGDGLRGPLFRGRRGAPLRGRRHTGGPHSPGPGAAGHRASREVQLDHLAQGQQGHFSRGQHNRRDGLPEHHTGLHRDPVHALAARLPDEPVRPVRRPLRPGLSLLSAAQGPAQGVRHARCRVALHSVRGGGGRLPRTRL
ncbi:MAG: Sodium/calcium exchanger membrane region, partial [uncultured Rubrobacteraceae bacterium]